MIEIRCDGTADNRHYLLSDVMFIEVVREAPDVFITKSPVDGDVLPDGQINFAGTISDRIRDGPPNIFADIKLSKVQDPAVIFSTRVYAESVPNGPEFDWTITADLGRFGVRRVVTNIVAEDAFGNRTNIDITKSTMTKSFTINAPPPTVSISTPAAGQRINPTNAISGLVVDPLGLRQITLSVYEGNGHSSAMPSIVMKKFTVSGTRAHFSYSEIGDEDLRYGTSYVVAIAVTNGLGHEFPPVQTTFIYSYRDESLAIISDKTRSESETLRGIDALPKMSTMPARAIDTLIDAMYGRGDNIGYSAASALIRIGRPAIPRIAMRWYMGNGTQLPYMLRAMSGMPADLQSELIPSISKAFHDLVWERRMAAEALGMLQHVGKEALPLLIEALHDPDADVRALAAQSIVYLHLRADAVVAVPGLVAMLHHENLAERMWATRALQAIGEPSREPLMPLLHDVSTQTVTFAAIALASISSATMVEQMPIFEKALRDGSQPVRYMALEVLTAMGGAARHAVPGILVAVRDVDPAVRSAAVQAVFVIDPDSDESRKALMGAMADVSLQHKIAWELGRRGASAAWAVPALAQALLEAPECFGNPAVNAAAEPLVKIGPASVPALIEVLRKGGNCQQATAIWALGEIGSPSLVAVSDLLKIVDSPDVPLSKQAVRALNKIDPAWLRKRVEESPATTVEDEVSEVEPVSIEKDIVPRLVHQLDDSYPWTAVHDLTALGPEARSAAPGIIKRIPSAQMEQLRGSLFGALDAVHGDTDTVVPALAKWLDSDDSSLRNWAADSLAHYSPASDALVPKISQLMEAGRIDFYFGVASLGEYGSAAVGALPVLKGKFKDPTAAAFAISAAVLIAPDDPAVRAAVHSVFKKGNADEKCRVATSILSLPRRNPALVDLVARSDVSEGPTLSCSFRFPKLLAKSGLGRQPTQAESHQKLHPEPGLRLTLNTPKNSFMVGESIPVTLRFEYKGKKPLSVTRKTYDRGGRMFHFGFDIRDSHGVRVPDPDLELSGGEMGGIFGTEPVSSTRPFVQTVEINQWFRLDHPGRFFITAAPLMVHSDQAAISVQSAPLEITLIPASDEFVAKSLLEDRVGLSDTDEWVRASAADRLRYLLDARAIPYLLAALEDTFGNVRISARYGLLAFADADLVGRAVTQAVEHGRPKDASANSVYAELLARAESKIALDPRDEDRMNAYERSLSRWRLTLEIRRARRLMKQGLTPTSALNGLTNDVLTVDDPGACEKALDAIVALKGEDRYQYSDFIWHCRTPRLIPRYRQIARDPSDASGLRPGVIQYLHDVHDPGWEQPIFADLASNKPVLGNDVYKLAVEFSTSAVAEKLLLSLESENSDRVVMAARILSSLAIPSDPRRVLYVTDHMVGLGNDSQSFVRIALASYLSRLYPEYGAPLIERMLRGDFPNGPRDRVSTIRSLAYLPARLGGASVRRLLASNDSSDRREMAVGLDLVKRDDRLTEPNPCGYFPDALASYASTSEPETKSVLSGLLQSCSGIPEAGSSINSATDASLPRQWKTWWKKGAGRQ